MVICLLLIAVIDCVSSGLAWVLFMGLGWLTLFVCWLNLLSVLPACLWGCCDCLWCGVSWIVGVYLLLWLLLIVLICSFC